MVKCPKCGSKLKPIPPCAGEWMCVNEDCPLCEMEVYGDTQAKLNKFVEKMRW